MYTLSLFLVGVGGEGEGMLNDVASVLSDCLFLLFV